MPNGWVGALSTLSVFALTWPAYAAPVDSAHVNATSLEDAARDSAQVTHPYTEEPAPLPYWSHGKSRPFVSGRAVAGLGFGRLALSGGYGKPHWIWAGPEAIGLISPYYSSLQAGLMRTHI